MLPAVNKSKRMCKRRAVTFAMYSISAMVMWMRPSRQFCDSTMYCHSDKNVLEISVMLSSLSMQLDSSPSVRQAQPS